jgi:hypothetical protein
MTDLLDRMRLSPAADWTIGDVMTVCAQHGVRCVPPSGGGSHYKVSHPFAPGDPDYSPRATDQAGIYPQAGEVHRGCGRRRCRTLITLS